MEHAFEITEKPVLTIAPGTAIHSAQAPVLPAVSATVYAADVFAPGYPTEPRPALEPPVISEAEPGTPTKAKILGEREMRRLNASPPGGFPKSIHGYKVAAVDDYMRKINGRLENLLSLIQEETSRADQSNRLLEQTTAELDTVRRRASDSERREAAALDGQQRSEESAARLALELHEAYAISRAEIERALIDARSERDTVLEEQRREAEDRTAELRRMAALQVSEAQLQLQSLREEAAQMSAELEALRTQAVTRLWGANLTEPMPAVEERDASLEADVDTCRAYVRAQLDMVIEEARGAANETGVRVALLYREHEERMREIGEECEVLMMRLREAAGDQLGRAASLPLRSASAPAANVALRAGEPDEKRLRDNREWRNGDWRAAS
jgi:hypothetical protein